MLDGWQEQGKEKAVHALERCECTAGAAMLELTRVAVDALPCLLLLCAQAIRMHEEGKGHQEAYIAQQKALREKKAAQASADKTAARQWAELDEAATIAYEKDLIAQGKVPPPRASAIAAASAAAAAAAHPVKPVSSRSLPAPPSAAGSSSSSAAAAPAPPAAKVSPWQATLDPSTGATYYYNIQTMATSWTNPDLAAAPSGPDAQPAAAAAAGLSKKERKALSHAIGAKQERDAAATKKEGVDEAGEEGKEEGPKSKKQRTGSSAAGAAPVAPAAPMPVEIDEDTGIGRWETVAAPPEPTAAEAAAAASRPRMTPFGMSEPTPSSSASAAAAAAAAAAAPVPAGKWANSRLPGDDADDADDDGDAPPIDVAQQLRNQFGPSKLISTRTTLYESGASLLDDPEADAAAAAAAATNISFKKKRDRSANVRKPIAPTNN